MKQFFMVFGILCLFTKMQVVQVECPAGGDPQEACGFYRWDNTTFINEVDLYAEECGIDCTFFPWNLTSSGLVLKLCKLNGETFGIGISKRAVMWSVLP